MARVRPSKYLPTEDICVMVFHWQNTRQTAYDCMHGYQHVFAAFV